MRGWDLQRRFEVPRPEGLTREPKAITVACGTMTRLAVVICADLNDELIPGLLQQAGVNLLLVPALTPHDGAFNDTVARLASSCQGMTVIANGSPLVDPDAQDAPEPFMVMAGVPRIDPAEQTSLYAAPEAGRRVTGIFDPRKRLSVAMDWRDA